MNGARRIPTPARPAGLAGLAGPAMPAGAELVATPTTEPVDITEPAEPASVPDRSQVPWQRLHTRVIWVDTAKILISIVPSYLTMFVFNLGFDSVAIWSAVVTTVIGVGTAISDLLRWLKTRYRITDERVELRTGMLFRKYRFVARERIRTVDTSAPLRYRVAALRIVHIGSGEARPPFKLDAVSGTTAEALRRELIRGRANGAAGPGDGTQPAADGPATGRETPIARLRWSWILYNLVNVWAFLAAAFLFWSAYWASQLVNIDLGAFLRRVVDWDGLGTGWSIAVGIGGMFALGVIALAVGFVKDNWGFQLVRAVTGDSGTALVTRQGLLKTREVYRDDRRLRGVHVSEPLFWRWMGLCETQVISTGLAGWSPGSEPASSILPRGPISEAHRVAALVLADGLRPLEAPLRHHSPRALYRRLVWAVFVPGYSAGLLAWLGATGAIAGWVWLLAVVVLPASLAGAVVAYRSLGHSLVGPYLVLRCGLSRRSTAALQRQAVIGWTVRQSLVQRLLGLVTVGASTAAGSRFYHAPDLGADQAVRFINEVSPRLIAEFLDHGGDTPEECVHAGVLLTTTLVRNEA